VVGPPNTGKSTLFNALTGFRQHVGNYPGVTVEKRIGHLQHGGASGEVVLVDLPGMYSLSVESADEAIVLDVLGGLVDGLDAPDVILVVVDATKLHRHLFLVSQLLELDRPVVVALNMTDLADARGVRIDTAALSRVLGTAVVPIVATRRIGIAALRRAVTAGLNGRPSRARVALPPCVSREVEALGRRVAAVAGDGGGAPSHVGLLQMLLHPNGHTERELVRRFGDRFSVELSERRRRIEAAGAPLAEVEAAARYGWIDRACQGVVTESGPAGPSRTVAADRVLTHRVYGLLIFMGVLVLVFQALYTWAAPLMDGIDAGFVSVQRWVTAVVPDGAVQSLVANGVVAGVGGVLVFLPQILILFLFIAILEDCGYMARAAFLVDRYMSAVGLNGKAVIPLLSSFACAVPGIMATRTIGGRNDRLITMLIAPLMSCSARLPVYTVLIGAFIAPRPVLGSWVNLQAVTLLAMYVLGVVVAIVVALVLRRTVLKGASPPFLMELPTYKWPSPSTVF
ncbi:MAG: ferrous iron transport protein B, partial [Phycisphaerae bacterium]